MLGSAATAQTIKSRADWQHITNCHIWQHDDDESDHSTQAIIQELGEGCIVRTINHHYEGYNNLNEFSTDAPDTSRAALSAKIKGVQSAQKSYDTSATVKPGRHTMSN